MPGPLRVLGDGDGFPPIAAALEEPNGLLAVGGELTPERLLSAYAHGIFPWYDDDTGPVLWWSPDPRAVLGPGELHISKSLRKRLRRKEYRLSMDTRFTEVLAACAEPRSDPKDTAGTWITPEMCTAYTQLHQRGFAHSVEAWYQDTLVGGLYGVSLGRMFFGESMFSRRNDASKVALVGLAAQLEAWEFTLIDCQMLNPHLERLGVYEIPRSEFADRLDTNARAETRLGPWQFDVELP
ncbi:MAG: leucyl/phenylalanyl-tRNA--protein transferase [Gammaproteobacteria bacterium]|nr:MAG: leucyl/phenylalanyl-tRNA--protein transferase [Gammaproteobacteria bacterium]